MLVCETRKDTDHDGKTEALWGVHDELIGAEPAPFLIRRGKSEEIDELVAADPERRHLVLVCNKKVKLLKIDSGARARETSGGSTPASESSSEVSRRYPRPARMIRGERI